VPVTQIRLKKGKNSPFLPFFAVFGTLRPPIALADTLFAVADSPFATADDPTALADSPFADTNSL
jgi:hypothetical protein